MNRRDFFKRVAQVVAVGSVAPAVLAVEAKEFEWAVDLVEPAQVGGMTIITPFWIQTNRLNAYRSPAYLQLMEKAMAESPLALDLSFARVPRRKFDFVGDALEDFREDLPARGQEVFERQFLGRWDQESAV